ncbi:DUF397 domain-containing protein [Streptomyces sp. 769]|uniref:DUF397 domain-containing protein n=1 Tax=Streptomyces sp. 769 TaxID=1262452 RepID=UPI00193A9878|nr:DUF397 domain-containing protein [Streptomyces sp. 769]
MTQHQRFPTSTDLAPESAWTKSSYSSQNNGNCVEVADLAYTGHVGIRDSKDKQGPAIVVPKSAWSSFVGYVGA